MLLILPGHAARLDLGLWGQLSPRDVGKDGRGVDTSLTQERDTVCGRKGTRRAVGDDVWVDTRDSESNRLVDRKRGQRSSLW